METLIEFSKNIGMLVLGLSGMVASVITMVAGGYYWFGDAKGRKEFGLVWLQYLSGWVIYPALAVSALLGIVMICISGLPQ